MTSAPGTARPAAPAAPVRPARPTRVEVDPTAIAHNVARLRERVAPSRLWAVVKADGYGHGAVTVACAALAAGAEGVAVALVEEGEELRRAGIDAPLLLLSEPPPGTEPRVVAEAIEPAVYSDAAVAALADAAADAGVRLPVHLKVDTGMHRVGVAPEAAVSLAGAISASEHLELASVWSHLAVADRRDDPFTAEQTRRFDDACAAIEAAGIAVPRRHLANSAGAMVHPSTRFDLVRAGIAVYGIAPAPELEGVLDLRPALRLVSEVSHVKVVAAGETVSYGRLHRIERPTVVATVPVGYADGVRRALGARGGEVLLGGHRRRIAGAVTMDQITVDCGTDDSIRVGDEVVLLGAQGAEEISAGEWAERLDTIAYEVTCGFGARLPRRRPSDGTG